MKEKQEKRIRQMLSETIDEHDLRLASLVTVNERGEFHVFAVSVNGNEDALAGRIVTAITKEFNPRTWTPANKLPL